MERIFYWLRLQFTVQRARSQKKSCTLKAQPLVSRDIFTLKIHLSNLTHSQINKRTSPMKVTMSTTLIEIFRFI